uniref:zinc finger protein DZIP1L-like n=1 Tax=Styela clava TaxID=7725 RepID=UPI001939275D|nr:zinc finger protein DZIP1L-like [Styela clava]
MAGETATQYQMFSSHLSPNRNYMAPPHLYEAEMGVPPESFAPVFQFRKRHGEINWRKVAMIDVDKVARELDIDTLQEHIQTVAFCNIDVVSDLDPMFAKLFKLSQYMIEYMLHSQSSLQAIIAELENNLDIAAAQQNSAQDKIGELNDDVQKLKAENKKRRKMIEQQQMLIESGASSYYKCPHCEKAFMNASFLQGHMQRKHPGSVNYIGDVIAHSQREQSRLAGRLQNLDEDLQQERVNFADKLKKAEEEKAAWGARTKRDMQRWKKEEEGKWRKELEEMKGSFLKEIQQLRAQESEYKLKITNLQMTMDERHSNLGELVDDIEGEKQKLSIYEQRIKSLEQTNADKESQLRQLSAEMASIRDRNRQALKDHQRQMADTYGYQLNSLKAKLNDRGKVPKEREIVPMAVPEAAVSYEEVDARPSDALSEMRRNQQNFARQMRPFMLQLMENKLQDCGVDPTAPGISSQTLANKLMVRKTERQRKAKEQPGFFSIRDQMRRKVDEEASRRGSPPRKRRGRAPSHLPRQRQFSPSPVSASRSLEQYPSGPQFRQTAPAGRIDHPPSPKRRNGNGPSVKRKQDKPMTREELNTRFEDDESPWDSELSEQRDIPGPSRPQEPQLTPSTGRQATTPKTPITTRIPTTTSTQRQEDSWDSDELDDILSPETDIRETRPKSSGSTKIQKLGANIESQLQSRTTSKPPAGSVDLMAGKHSVTGSSTQVKHFDSDDDDFSPVSSLHEPSPKPAPRGSQQALSKVHQSTASSTNTLGTSVWGSNQGKPGTGKNATADQQSDWDDDISDL